MSKMRTTDC